MRYLLRMIKIIEITLIYINKVLYKSLYVNVNGYKSKQKMAVTNTNKK